MKYQISKDRDCFGLKRSTGKRSYVSFLSVAFFLSVGMGTTVSAQIMPDTTLPNNSVADTVTLPNGNVIEITGGTSTGSNLFHSFEQFSLPTGNTAWFNNDVTIDNIITRVTGGSISDIDGLIRANGTANLFLINPNGIIFGENAALDIGGSFIGSTADSIKFADGSEFSAVDPQAPPLLTVNIPMGLQYGTNNGDIVVRGSGNQLAFNPDFTVNRDSRPVGLEVNNGQTLALVGGNVFVEGGNLTAETGKIELGSVDSNSLVQLNSTSSGWSLDYGEVSNFKDINLSQAASLEVSGNGGGDVTLQGRQIIITDGSAILADNVGDINAGKLQVNASELLVVAGTAANLPFISRLSTDVAPGATGNGGDIELNGGTLIVTDGAQVISSTYGSGNTGNIRVKADDVELVSGSPIAFSSGIFTLVFGSGNGGNVDVEANNIFVLDGAQAAALTFGAGAGGNLDAKANSIELTGTSPGGTSSSFATNTEGSGQGGNLTIESEYLLVADGGAVQSSVFGAGNGGNLLVKADRVELLRGAPGVGASGLFANVEPGATGDGGLLTIDTQSLLIADGAQAAVTTFGEGNAGLLEVKANEIELIGTSPGGSSSGLFSNVEQGAIGNGGQIDIETERLQISDGAQVASTTKSSGMGGTIEVKADEIEVIGGSSNAPSGLFTAVEAQTSGNGGNLSIETGSLTLSDGAQIAISTAGSGHGGELNITANRVELIGGSGFGASGIFGNAIASTGNGGNIELITNSLNIQDGATISASNFSSSGNAPPGQGKAGNISIETNSLKLDTSSAIPSTITASTNAGGGGQITLNVAEALTVNNGSQISADTQGSGDGGNIDITAHNVQLNSQGKISTNSIGTGQAGNIAIAAGKEINANEGKITATSMQSGGGNINLTTDFLLMDNNSLVSTSVTDSTGGGGNLTIDSNYVIAQNNSDLRANAVLGQGGNIDITTKVILLSLDSDVDASSQFGLDGVVEIKSPESEQQIGIVRFSDEVEDPTGLISSLCPVELDNVLVTTGKGGLAENPSQTLRSQSFWDDIRDFSASSKNNPNLSVRSPSPPTERIIEAEGWKINSEGELELFARVPFNQCQQ